VQLVLTPSVARRLLGYSLRRYRLMAGKTQEQAAERVDIKQGSLAGFETARAAPGQPVLELLLDFYGRASSFPQMAVVRRIAAQTHRDDQQQAVQRTDLVDFDLYRGLEWFARRIEAYEPALVHGLLQTEATARAVLEDHARHTGGVDVGAALRERLDRQRVLWRDESDDLPSPCLRLYIEADRLRRPVVDRQSQAEQLDHLATAMARTNVEVRVIPDEVAIHPAQRGTATLLDMGDWQVGYAETWQTASYYDHPEAIGALTRIMAHLQAVSLGPQDSLVWITSAANELREGG
jgi:transcriptional regulator with XRE-family HTH domain